MNKTDCVKFNACKDASGNKPLPCRTCKHFIPKPGTTKAKLKKMEKKMGNKLTDLNDALFAQLDRINEDLSSDELSKEITRSAAICGISKQIIDNASLALKAHTSINSGMTKKTPKMLEE